VKEKKKPRGRERERAAAEVGGGAGDAWFRREARGAGHGSLGPIMEREISVFPLERKRNREIRGREQRVSRERGGEKRGRRL
jgi:hypothetical protein